MTAHSHHEHAHDHPHAPTGSTSALRAAVLLTLGFAAVEALGGWWAGSLALIADAGHMLTDAAALLLAWFAAWLARRPPDARMTYGYRRAEVLAALVNALLMLGVLLFLLPAAIERLQQPRAVDGASVMVIAAIGLAVNLVVFRLLHRADHGALNTRGALLHVMGDLLGSVAALLAGTIVWLTGWTPIDPLLSLLIAALLLVSALRLLREVYRVLMDAVPVGIALDELRTRLLAVDGVDAVHDLHVWTQAGDRMLLSAHVGIRDNAAWARVLVDLQQLLRDEYGIGHATLQPEPPEYRALLCERCGEPPLDDHAH